MGSLLTYILGIRLIVNGNIVWGDGGLVELRLGEGVLGRWFTGCNVSINDPVSIIKWLSSIGNSLVWRGLLALLVNKQQLIKDNKIIRLNFMMIFKI